jgi:ATP-dependent exoDNAse (exonuclease V) beta subunit
VRKVTYEWAGDTSRHVGTVVHELLKHMARQGSAAWPADRVTHLAPFVRSELLRLGVGRFAEPQASAQVIRAVNNALTSERGRWILDATREAHSEFPIAGRVNEKLITGKIDRVFRDEQGRLWIIDFKTSQHEGARLEAFLDEEERRYGPQLKSYAILMSHLSQGPIHLGLYFPLLDGWREWQFEEQESALLAH